LDPFGDKKYSAKLWKIAGAKRLSAILPQE
jgi:hypothetical protein